MSRLDQLLAATNAERVVIKPQPRKPVCQQCRGAGWVWLINAQTHQKEIGDCPACGATRPVLPENSHRIVTRYGRHNPVKPKAKL